MSQFSKFKLLFALKKFNGDNFIKECQNLVISKSWKKSEKIGVFEKIVCGNKIGRGNALRKLAVKRSNQRRFALDSVSN